MDLDLGSHATLRFKGVKQVGESRFEAYDLENQLIGTFSTSIMAALAHDTEVRIQSTDGAYSDDVMNFDRYGRLVDHPDAVTDDTAQLAVPTLNTASRALSTSKEGRVSACDGPGSTQGCKHTESRVVVSGESSVQADKKEEEEEDRPLTPSPTLFEKEMSALLGVGQRGCVTSLVTPGGVTKTSRGTGGKAATPEAPLVNTNTNESPEQPNGLSSTTPTRNLPSARSVQPGDVPRGHPGASEEGGSHTLGGSAYASADHSLSPSRRLTFVMDEEGNALAAPRGQGAVYSDGQEGVEAMTDSEETDGIGLAFRHMLAELARADAEEDEEEEEEGGDQEGQSRPSSSASSSSFASSRAGASRPNTGLPKLEHPQPTPRSARKEEVVTESAQVSTVTTFPMRPRSARNRRAEHEASGAAEATLTDAGVEKVSPPNVKADGSSTGNGAKGGKEVGEADKEEGSSMAGLRHRLAKFDMEATRMQAKIDAFKKKYNI